MNVERSVQAQTGSDLASCVEQLNTRGITAMAGAFSPEWAATMHEDILTAYDEAAMRPAGRAARGPQRYYVEIHPEQLRGFVELVSHPWVTGICAAVLGPDYEIVELGFDIPFPAAKDQPWHRDFPSDPVVYDEHRLTSLAFNLTAVDTEPNMGPFQIAPGTHFESGAEFAHQMFPARNTWARYLDLAETKLPRAGDISARSALTLHRGTANQSDRPRPVLVLGVDAPGAGHAELHDMQMTRDFAQSLPPDVRRHLVAQVVDELTAIDQRHTIEGLVMGEDSEPQ